MRLGGARIVRALRHRNFRIFVGGQLVSLIGTWMQTVAQAWLVYRLTGSSVLLGVVGFAGQIPVLLFATLGGAVADRFNRHRTVLLTQASSMLLALALAGLTLSGRIQVWQILTLAAMLGTVNGFDIPARQAFVVELVSREDLPNAIALNSSMFNGARVIGPAIAGLVVAAVGEGWCFFANAVSYLGVIAGLLLMRIPPRARPPMPASALAHTAAGFRFVAKTGPILALLLLLGLVSLVGMPYAVLMPIMADRVFHAGATGLGILMGAAGSGALIGALTLAARTSVAGLGRWVVFGAAGFGVSLVGFAAERSLWPAAVLLLPAGCGLMVQMASSNTLIQSMVPDHLRGRVMAVYSMMFMGMAPLGALLAGVAADRIGAPMTIGAGGVIAIAGAAVFARWLPRLRPEARRLLSAQEMAQEGQS